MLAVFSNCCLCLFYFYQVSPSTWLLSNLALCVLPFKVLCGLAFCCYALVVALKVFKEPLKVPCGLFSLCLGIMLGVHHLKLCDSYQWSLSSIIAPKDVLSHQVNIFSTITTLLKARDAFAPHMLLSHFMFAMFNQINYFRIRHQNEKLDWH